jgi:hypothetical protein
VQAEQFVPSASGRNISPIAQDSPAPGTLLISSLVTRHHCAAKFAG